MAANKIVLTIALAAWVPSLAFATTPGQVYESVKDSVVVVKVYDRKGKQTGFGSGVVLPSGDIITNYHVIRAGVGVRYSVGRGKHIVPATFKGGDEAKDLCLLNAPGLVAEPARLGRADKLKVGDPVYAVGAPQGLELSLSEGIISQLRGGGPHPIIQTTVAISPGSSGGGLFNAEGELVGITSLQVKGGQNLNFALPVEWIKRIPTVIDQFDPPQKPKTRGDTIARPEDDWENRATALDKAQDWPGMLAHSRRWTQAEPGNVSAWFALGYAYANLGRHREAVEAYQKASRLNPDNLVIWHNLGREYASLSRYREAIGAYREALRIEPDFADAWYNLGATYANSGNRTAALEAVKELRRHDPKEADKLFNLIMKP
jgi:hypothetical protein